MEKIYFLDIKNSGHHWIYNYNLLSGLNKDCKVVYITAHLDEEKKLELKKNNILYKEIDNIVLNNNNNKILKNINYFFIIFKVIVFLIRNKAKKFVVLYLDDFIYQISVFGLIFKIFNIKIYAVLHWYRKENMKERYLKKILRYKNKIIVHTEYIQKNLEKLNNTVSIDIVEYPMCHTIVKNNRRNVNSKIKILHFGGTRLDKGIDILLNALKLNTNSIELIIAGKTSEHFNEKYIKKEILNIPKHDFKLDLQFISDEETNKYFNDTDIVVLPYRKHFNGESGVFIQALTYGKPLIVPNIIHFPYIVNKFDNGVVFECENEQDLAKKIDILVSNIDYYKKNAEKYSSTFIDIHSIDNFVYKYRNILID